MGAKDTTSRARKVATMRLCLYDPDPDSDTLIPIGKRFRDTKANRRLFRDVIADYNQKSEQERDCLCMGMFPGEG